MARLLGVSRQPSFFICKRSWSRNVVRSPRFAVNVSAQNNDVVFTFNAPIN